MTTTYAGEARAQERQWTMGKVATSNLDRRLFEIHEQVCSDPECKRVREANR